MTNPTKLLLLIVAVALVGSCSALVESQLTNYPQQLGDTKINITREYFPIPSDCKTCNANLAFLNLHENENTSVVAARAVLLTSGGSLVRFTHGNSRLISFKLDGVTYTFDPNRMFTPEGIESTLKTYGPYSTAAASEVQKFASSLLEIYDFDNQQTVLALHNNGGSYGANSYLPGQTYADDAIAVNIVNGTNPSDFFYVVDWSIYNYLSEKQYNVVLQNNDTVSNDGSLSVYAGMEGKPYINFESQAEYSSYGYQTIIQLDMVIAIQRMLNGNE
jgi:hypothetical protein